jgi:hypothetical protein
MKADDVKRLKELEVENARLKRIVSRPNARWDVTVVASARSWSGAASAMAGSAAAGSPLSESRNR